MLLFKFKNLKWVFILILLFITYQKYPTIVYIILGGYVFWYLNNRRRKNSRNIKKLERNLDEIARALKGINANLEIFTLSSKIEDTVENIPDIHDSFEPEQKAVFKPMP